LATTGAGAVGTYNTADIRQVTLTPDRTGVASVAIVFQASKSVLSMERGPDGTLYFSDTSAIYRLAQQ
jgi:hypothetical protein